MAARSPVFDLMRMTVLEFTRQPMALHSGATWLVPDAGAAARLAVRGISRGRIWTATELVDVARPHRIIAALLSSNGIGMDEGDDIDAELV